MIWPLVLAGALAGAVAGSFIATIAIRWPQGRSAMRGRSECDACHRPLGVVDLVPLLGFILRRGKCASCASRIDPRHPIVELAAALIGGIALAASPDLAGAAGAVFGWQLLLLAVLDIDHHWLPDRLTLTLALTGIAAGLAGMDPALADRLIGAAAGFTSLALIALAYKLIRNREGMGGGDPKLFGAIGAWLGWQALPFVLLAASLIGLGAVLGAMARRQPMSGTTRLPLGALLAVAAFPVWVLMV